LCTPALYVGTWERRRAAAQRRRELRERAVAYLGGSCSICKYDGCASAFDFHHVNPLEKDFTISSKMTSWEAIERELKKCVLLCCRCHREVHDGMHPGYLQDESHNRGADERQLAMFDDEPEEEEESPTRSLWDNPAENWKDPFPGVTSLRDPNVTPEQIRQAMEPRPEDAFPEPTLLDLLQPLD
jgi:5-methylcytosine-specific restriction endonuclease McrA